MTLKISVFQQSKKAWANWTLPNERAHQNMYFKVPFRVKGNPSCSKVGLEQFSLSSKFIVLIERLCSYLYVFCMSKSTLNHVKNPNVGSLLYKYLIWKRPLYKLAVIEIFFFFIVLLFVFWADRGMFRSFPDI